MCGVSQFTYPMSRAQSSGCELSLMSSRARRESFEDFASNVTCMHTDVYCTCTVYCTVYPMIHPHTTNSRLGKKGDLKHKTSFYSIPIQISVPIHPRSAISSVTCNDDDLPSRLVRCRYAPLPNGPWSGIAKGFGNKEVGRKNSEARAL